MQLYNAKEFNATFHLQDLTFDEYLKLFSEEEHKDLLTKGLFGFEKEALRVTENGTLALTDHPSFLGDKLTHESITTDFSESQLEFITKPHPTIEEAENELLELHLEVMTQLDGEMVWPFSMPCRLPENELIPIAKYGESKEGKQRELYREGLANRYGKPMQTLCGVHFNFSFTDKFWFTLYKAHNKEQAPSSEELQSFKNDQYLKLVRNFIRYRWILVVLTGASPFFDPESYGCPGIPRDKSDAVSLRLSRCGYSNPAKIPMSYNTFSKYLKDYKKALNTHHPEYEKYAGKQINSNLLQIPNEYYFPIRIKPKTGENILQGLESYGAEYIELRLFDVNPFRIEGIDARQYTFVHLFIIYCLFKESLPLDEKQLRLFSDKQAEVALSGAKLKEADQKEGYSVLKDMKVLLPLLPTQYTEAWEFYFREFTHPVELPWKRIKDSMEASGQDFLDYGILQTLTLKQDATSISDSRI